MSGVDVNIAIKDSAQWLDVREFSSRVLITCIIFATLVIHPNYQLMLLDFLYLLGFQWILYRLSRRKYLHSLSLKRSKYFFITYLGLLIAIFLLRDWLFFSSVPVIAIICLIGYQIDFRPDGNFSADAPIVSLSQDVLKRENLAKTILKNIENNPHPNIFSVSGKWGSGKSSLMRLVVHLAYQRRRGVFKEPKYHHVWINVWELEKADSMSDAFLQALVNAIRQQCPTIWWMFLEAELLLRFRFMPLSFLYLVLTTLLKIVLITFPMIITVILSLIGVGTSNEAARLLLQIGGFGVSSLLAVWLLLPPIIAEVKKTVNLDIGTAFKDNPLPQKVYEIQLVKPILEKMVEALVGRDGRLLVFVDDFDRLRPIHLVETLESIKIFASTRRTVFLLGLDNVTAQKAISGEYEIPLTEASHYLEKFITFHFNIPPVTDEGIANFFQHILETEYFSQHELDKADELGLVVAHGVENVPRRIRMIATLFSVTKDFAAHRKFELDDELLIKTVLIQYSFPQWFQFLTSNPNRLRIILDIENGVPQSDLANDSNDVTLNEIEHLLHSNQLTQISRLLRSGSKTFSRLVDNRRDTLISKLIYPYFYTTEVITMTDTQVTMTQAILRGQIEVRPDIFLDSTGVAIITDAISEGLRYLPRGGVIGRETEVTQIISLMSMTEHVVVTGLSGMGTTTVVSAVALKVSSTQKATLWIDCKHKGYAQIITALKNLFFLPESSGLNELWRELEKTRIKHIILNDIQDICTLSELVESIPSVLTIIATTPYFPVDKQSQVQQDCIDTVMQFYSAYRLRSLSFEDSLKLFKNHMQIDESEIETSVLNNVVKLLGGCPQSLIDVASCLGTEQQYTPSKLLDHRNGYDTVKLENLRRHDSSETSAHTVFAPNLDSLSAEARNLLKRLATIATEKPQQLDCTVDEKVMDTSTSSNEFAELESWNWIKQYKGEYIINRLARDLVLEFVI